MLAVVALGLGLGAGRTEQPFHLNEVGGALLLIHHRQVGDRHVERRPPVPFIIPAGGGMDAEGHELLASCENLDSPHGTVRQHQFRRLQLVERPGNAVGAQPLRRIAETAGSGTQRADGHFIAFRGQAIVGHVDVEPDDFAAQNAGVARGGQGTFPGVDFRLASDGADVDPVL